MEQSTNTLHPEAATDEPASSLGFQRDGGPARPDSTPPETATRPGGADPPDFAEPPLLSDCLEDALADTLAETFPPDGRKPRHDGWTPEVVAGFLRALAAAGVVEHAVRMVRRSAASAYALRNRREGRAFAKMWDAVLIHRARARLASELQGRAIAGCVSVRRRDGEIVGEYHYYDNRLAMSLLTRLDRLAEREAASDAQLRALSEDLDDYIDCVAEGGDPDAFVEARRPVEPEPEPEPAPPPPEPDPGLSTFAQLAGCSDYRDVDPREIEVLDLDPSARADWSPDQWVRAFRSGFMTWLKIPDDDAALPPGPGAPFCYFFSREAARAANDHPGSAGAAPEEIDTSDLDTAAIWNWTDDQLARAFRSRFLQGLPDDFWETFAAGEAGGGEEE